MGCIHHLLHAPFLPLDGTCSLRPMTVIPHHPVDVDAEARGDKAEDDDEKQRLVGIGKALHLSRRTVYPRGLGKLAPCRHLLLIPLLVLGVVLVGHILAHKHPSDSFYTHTARILEV